MDMNDFWRYNKIKTGIPGLDVLLYGGLVIPYDITKDTTNEKDCNKVFNQNLLIVIRGNDNIERTILSLQLLQAIGNAFKNQKRDIVVHYYSSKNEEDYIHDLQLDIIISSVVKNMIEKEVSGKNFEGNKITNFFFDTDNVVEKEHGLNANDEIPYELIKERPDEMICKEALYYNARTSALHFRMSSTKDDSPYTDTKNVIYKRRYNKLNDYIDGKDIIVSEIENKLGMSFVRMDVRPYADDQIVPFEKNDGEEIICFNFSSSALSEKNIDDRYENLQTWMDNIRKNYKVGIVVADSNMAFPTEKADFILDMNSKCYESYDYLIHTIEITKSLFQMTALGQHQYKRRDYGIEIYPSLPVYCMQRRYLQRALVYTHSNVLLDTYQQYLDNTEGSKYYKDYRKVVNDISDVYFNALLPTANKKISVHQIMDRIFIHPDADKILNNLDFESGGKSSGKRFLYGSDAGATAVIGEANTFKRFLTFGSAFSSAHRHEHTLFLLLNKDDKVIRRRLLCPAMNNKCNKAECKVCYNYHHFMNILMGCITPEEFLFYLIRQLDVPYPDGKIKRIIIDDLQIIDFCFPLLSQDTLFLPALIDECKHRGIALYLLCDKNASLVKSLRSLADNVVCTERDAKGNTNIYVERYAGYHTQPSKISAGQISKMEDLFECYEKGSYENRKSYFNFDSDIIKELKIYSMDFFWNSNN